MVGCHLPRSSKERIPWKQLTYTSARLLSTRRGLVQDRRNKQRGTWRLGNLVTPESVQKLQTALHAKAV